MRAHPTPTVLQEDVERRGAVVELGVNVADDVLVAEVLVQQQLLHGELGMVSGWSVGLGCDGRGQGVLQAIALMKHMKVME